MGALFFRARGRGPPFISTRAPSFAAGLSSPSIRGLLPAMAITATRPQPRLYPVAVDFHICALPFANDLDRRVLVIAQVDFDGGALLPCPRSRPAVYFDARALVRRRTVVAFHPGIAARDGQNGDSTATATLPGSR